MGKVRRARQKAHNSAVKIKDGGGNSSKQDESVEMDLDQVLIFQIYMYITVIILQFQTMGYYDAHIRKQWVFTKSMGQKTRNHDLSISYKILI